MLINCSIPWSHQDPQVIFLSFGFAYCIVSYIVFIMYCLITCWSRWASKRKVFCFTEDLVPTPIKIRCSVSDSWIGKFLRGVLTVILSLTAGSYVTNTSLLPSGTQFFFISNCKLPCSILEILCGLQIVPASQSSALISPFPWPYINISSSWVHFMAFSLLYLHSL